MAFTFGAALFVVTLSPTLEVSLSVDLAQRSWKHVMAIFVHRQYHNLSAIKARETLDSFDLQFLCGMLKVRYISFVVFR